MRDIRIATAVLPSSIGRLQANFDRMAHWIEAAKTQGAELICFPEMNLTGYCTGPESRNTAVTIPGPLTDQLSETARAHNMVILCGLAEKASADRIYASHLALCPDGRLEIYRKIHIAPPEKNLFSSGDHILVFAVQGVKIGIQLCYDAHFPELSTRMALKGAEVIFMPHASPRGTPLEKYNSWCRHLTARAFDNGLFVVACNQSGTNESGLSFPGLALAVDPSGEVMAKKLDGQEGLLVCDLSAQDLERVRGHRMRYFLPHRRPDIYHTAD